MNRDKHNQWSSLAHLSQRLIGELIGYLWSGVRPLSSSSPFTMLKDLLLWNRFANQSQILCGASLGRRKWYFVCSIWVTWPRWLPCPYMVKTFKNLLFQNRRADFHETWYVASGTPAHHSLFKWWPWSDLNLFYGKVKFGNLGFSMG